METRKCSRCGWHTSHAQPVIGGWICADDKTACRQRQIANRKSAADAFMAKMRMKWKEKTDAN